jgi:hypothetical protein
LPPAVTTADSPRIIAPFENEERLKVRSKQGFGFMTNIDLSLPKLSIKDVDFYNFHRDIVV